MNILVATPGRLLQHMDQTFGFDADNLQMLGMHFVVSETKLVFDILLAVLDEADRILDMGFQRTLSALLSHLPKSRQTLLFSATQTQSVSDLARLSLKDPVPIGISSPGESTDNMYIPATLEQHYVVCDLDKKLDILWSFIKTHLQCKTLVFMSACKQVRFVYETFCRMHPGIPLIHLHGKQKQSARLTMFNRFTTTKHAVLFATDIAARGLDFPSVDWVVQLDAPEDVETYIHRVGRTARYESKGKGLLVVCPSEEEGMKMVLEKKGLKVNKIKIRPSKTQNIENQLQKLAFQDPEIKYLAQRVRAPRFFSEATFTNNITDFCIVFTLYLFTKKQIDLQDRRITCGTFRGISWASRCSQDQVFKQGSSEEAKKRVEIGRGGGYRGDRWEQGKGGAAPRKRSRRGFKGRRKRGSE
jgi:ATP-dependent RNA helicase DDX10/DBP4